MPTFMDKLKTLHTNLTKEKKYKKGERRLSGEWTEESWKDYLNAQDKKKKKK